MIEWFFELVLVPRFIIIITLIIIISDWIHRGIKDCKRRR